MWEIRQLLDVPPAGVQAGAPLTAGRTRLPRGRYLVSFAGTGAELNTDKTGYTCILIGNGGTAVLTPGQPGAWPGGLVSIVRLWCGDIGAIEVTLHKTGDIA